MEQHEADLIRDLVEANRREILARLDSIDAQGKKNEQNIELLQKEYDAVLIEQKVNKRLIKILMGVGSFGGTLFSIVQILLALHIL